MIHDLTDFTTDVVERSRQTPVVIEFHAQWCSPCRRLGSILEKLSSDSDGAWELVRINVDEHPDLAARFQVRSIPNAKLIINGIVTDEFNGFRSESQVANWLDRNLDNLESLSASERHTHGREQDRVAS